jgi:hypothetical protein
VLLMTSVGGATRGGRAEPAGAAEVRVALLASRLDVGLDAPYEFVVLPVPAYLQAGEPAIHIEAAAR